MTCPGCTNEPLPEHVVADPDVEWCDTCAPLVIRARELWAENHKLRTERVHDIIAAAGFPMGTPWGGLIEATYDGPVPLWSLTVTHEEAVAIVQHFAADAWGITPATVTRWT